MLNDDQNNWLIIMIVAFMGGIVSNIVKPKRRGLVGFVAAGIISVFCGGVSGICASSFGMGNEGQIFIAAIVGISADRILTMYLCGDEKTINNFNATNQQNQIGDKNEQR